MKKVIILIIGILFILSTTAFSQTEDMETKVLRIKHSNAESLHPIAEGLKSKGGKLIIDKNTNSLIIVDRPGKVENITNVIMQLDEAQKQVEVKVVIAETTKEFLSGIGLDSGQIIIPSGQFDAVLNLLDEDKDTNIRSQMTVKTVSNQPALIQATVDEIFGTVVTRYDHDMTIVTPLITTTGDMLEVLPRVNNDGTITVALRPSSSSLEEDGTLAKKGVLTQVIVKDGDTVAIGGVDRSAQETTRKTVSFLDMPISKKRTKKNSRVTMFLTATISD